MFCLVAARPDISLITGPIYAESGKNVKLPKCQVIGYPPPVISWTKLFDQIPSERAVVEGQTLTIVKAKKKDAGTYICSATNVMGTSHAMTTLIINIMPQFTVRPPKMIEHYLGQSVTLNCSADGHPVPSITWSRCKGHIPEGRTQVENGQLKINSLTAADSDTYTCRAQSELVHVETEVKVVVKTGEKSLSVRGHYKSVIMSPDNDINERHLMNIITVVSFLHAIPQYHNNCSILLNTDKNC